MTLPTTKTPAKTSYEDLTIYVYAESGFGKSTWASKASRPLFLATEAGLNHLDTYQVPVTTWDAFRATAKELIEKPDAFRTIVIDTIDNAYQQCVDYVCAKNKWTHPSDGAYGKGFHLCTQEFMRVLTRLSLLPSGLVLISHTKEKEIVEKNGTKRTRTVPSLPEGPKAAIIKMSDLVLYGDYEVSGDRQSRRVFRTKLTADYDAKDRTGKLPETIGTTYEEFQAAFGSK